MFFSKHWICAAAVTVALFVAGSAMSSISNNFLDSAFAINIKCLSDFDKHLQDFRDANKINSRATARTASTNAQNSFFAFSRQIDSTADSIVTARGFKSLGDDAMALATIVGVVSTIAVMLSFTDLAAAFPVLATKITGFGRALGTITTPVWIVVGALAVLSAGVLISFGYFPDSVVRVNPELSALARAASAAAAVNPALSIEGGYEGYECHHAQRYREALDDPNYPYQ